MFEQQPNEPQTPQCPMCTGRMALKQIYRQTPADHFIFKCIGCGLEYPVVGQKRAQ